MPTEFAHKDFYVVIAAILPILFLAISIQSSSFIRAGSHQNAPLPFKHMHAVMVALLLGLLTFFESLVLQTLYMGKDEYVKVETLGFIMILTVVYILLDFILSLYGKSKDFGLYVLLAVAGILILFFQLVPR